MQILVLAFLACVSPDRCRTVELPFDGTRQQCMLLGQQLAAQWVVEHPGWQLAGWLRCSEGRAA